MYWVLRATITGLLLTMDRSLAGTIPPASLLLQRFVEIHRVYLL